MDLTTELQQRLQFLDRINLTGISATGFHGVYADEQVNGQEFLVDAELYVDTRLAGKSDDLSQTVDYGQAAKLIEAILTGPHFDLIEALGQHLADSLLALPGVMAVKICLHKPQAPIEVSAQDVNLTIWRGLENVTDDLVKQRVIGDDRTESPRLQRARRLVAQRQAQKAEFEASRKPAYLQRPQVEPGSVSDLNPLLDQRPTRPNRAIIALGGNLGNVSQTLRSAITQLRAVAGIGVMTTSSLYRTSPVLAPGQAAQPDYYNAVVLVQTVLSARELWEVLVRIEQDHGRVRDQVWGPRTLDLDLIDYRGVEAADQQLTVPHPRALERAFVLVPWAEVEPTWIAAHPQALQRLLGFIGDSQAILEVFENWLPSAIAASRPVSSPLLPDWRSWQPGHFAASAGNNAIATRLTTGRVLDEVLAAGADSELEKPVVLDEAALVAEETSVENELSVPSAVLGSLEDTPIEEKLPLAAPVLEIKKSEQTEAESVISVESLELAKEEPELSPQPESDELPVAPVTVEVGKPPRPFAPPESMVGTPRQSSMTAPETPIEDRVSLSAEMVADEEPPQFLEETLLVTGEISNPDEDLTVIVPADKPAETKKPDSHLGYSDQPDFQAPKLSEQQYSASELTGVTWDELTSDLFEPEPVSNTVLSEQPEGKKQTGISEEKEASNAKLVTAGKWARIKGFFGFMPNEYYEPKSDQEAVQQEATVTDQSGFPWIETEPENLQAVEDLDVRFAPVSSETLEQIYNEQPESTTTLTGQPEKAEFQPRDVNQITVENRPFAPSEQARHAGEMMTGDIPTLTGIRTDPIPVNPANFSLEELASMGQAAANRQLEEENGSLAEPNSERRPILRPTNTGSIPIIKTSTGSQPVVDPGEPA